MSGDGDDSWVMVPLFAGDRMPTSDPEDETLAAEPDAENQVPPEEVHDRASLRVLYEKCGGHLWLQRQWWMTSVPLRHWPGVTGRDGQVVRLMLRGNNLQGTGVTGVGLTERAVE